MMNRLRLVRELSEEGEGTGRFCLEKAVQAFLALVSISSRLRASVSPDKD